MVKLLTNYFPDWTKFWNTLEYHSSGKFEYFTFDAKDVIWYLCDISHYQMPKCGLAHNIKSVFQ